MKYSGFKVRFAMLYKGINGTDNEDVEEIINEIITVLSEMPAYLTEHFGLEFHSGKVHLVSGKYGKYIALPQFNLSFLGKYLISGDIRLNPCKIYKDSSPGKHYSKVWCIFAYDGKPISGKNVGKLLQEAHDLAQQIIQSVGSEYIKIVNPSPEIKDYWISIDSVSIDKANSDYKSISPLFNSEDKDELLESIGNNEDLRTALNDYLSWIDKSTRYSRNTFLNNIRKIQSKRKLKYRVANNDTADVFYSINNTDTNYAILGLGLGKTEGTDINHIDSLFHHKISNIINSL